MTTRVALTAAGGAALVIGFYLPWQTAAQDQKEEKPVET